jgi:hypothetical protein
MNIWLGDGMCIMTSGEKLYGQHLTKISLHLGPKRHRLFGKSSVHGIETNEETLRRGTKMFQKWAEWPFASF